MDWRDKAACLTADPELFFPVGNTGPAVDQIDKAKAVCGRCSVTEMCLQYALDTSQDSGVWGGLSAAAHHVVPVDGAAEFALDEGAHDLSAEAGADLALGQPHPVVPYLHA